MTEGRIRLPQSIKAVAALLIFPALLLLLFRPLLKAQGPFHGGEQLDPSYAYLMNSLLVINYQVPFHLDHPGTTVQGLGAATLRLMHPKLDRSQISREVIRAPEQHIRVLSFALMLLCASLIAASGWIVYRSNRHLGSALVFQIVPFSFFTTWQYVPSFAPDLLVLVLCMLFFALSWQAEEKTTNRYDATFLGLTFGAAMITKIVALPTLIVPLFIFGFHLRKLIIFALFSLIGFLIFGLPLLLNLIHASSVILNWMWGLASHSGTYGEGPKGLLSLDKWLTNFVQLVSHHPFLLVTAILAVILLVFKKLLRSNRLVIGALVMIIAQFIIVAKHPSDHYLIPAFGAAGFLVAFTALHLRSHQVGIVFVCLSVLISTLPLVQRLRDIPLGEVKASEFSKLDAAITSNHCDRVASFYRSSSPEFALIFGNTFAGSFFSKQIRELYPYAYVYEMSGRILTLDQQDVTALARLESEKGIRYCVRGWSSTILSNPKPKSLRLEALLNTEYADALYLVHFI